ncbi:MAG: TraR/DksA family transcriptional regulator [Bryobacteraceae bacterium]
MGRTEFRRYKAMLEAKQAELAADLLHREEIAIENAADALDQVQLAGARELAIRNLHRESVLLRNIRLALARLEDDSYGVCLRCECEINAKRLNAVPWTPYCIRCQEAADRDEFDSDSRDIASELLFRAA